MGISKLLVSLRDITTGVGLAEYEGLTAGVDASCWLHRGAYAAASEQAQGVETDAHVHFCLKRIRMLQSGGVTPFLVFDGAPVRVKRTEIADRVRLSEAARERGHQALAQGHAADAEKHFRKCVRVSFEMCIGVIRELRRLGLPYLVAPSEADAQLAYLSKEGLVDVVITEDSDALPFGCGRTLFKLTEDGGAHEIQRRDFAVCRTLPMADFTDDMFIMMCVLAGCDYCRSLRGVGIKTAHSIVTRCRRKRHVAAHLRKTYDLPDGFEERFARAFATFKYMRVFDPRTQRIVHLNPFDYTPAADEDTSFLGKNHPAHQVLEYADGRRNPYSGAPTSLMEEAEWDVETGKRSHTGSAAERRETATLDLLCSPGASTNSEPPEALPDTAASSEHAHGAWSAPENPEASAARPFSSVKRVGHASAPTRDQPVKVHSHVGFRRSRDFKSDLVGAGMETLQRKRMRQRAGRADPGNAEYDSDWAASGRAGDEGAQGVRLEAEDATGLAVFLEEENVAPEANRAAFEGGHDAREREGSPGNGQCVGVTAVDAAVPSSPLLEQEQGVARFVRPTTAFSMRAFGPARVQPKPVANAASGEEREAYWDRKLSR